MLRRVPPSLPRFFPGLVIAVLYAACAIGVVATERGESPSGWITLQGMGSFLVTMPVSAPAELLGMKLDFRKNLDMAVAIGGCAALVYFVVSLAAKAFATMRSR